MNKNTLQGKTVLCVDDDPYHIRLLKEIIESNGGMVLIAGNAKETFRIMEERIPDLLLLDIKLPGMNGYEMATKIKSSRRLSSVSVVALTVLCGPNEKEMAFMAGCDGYIKKPIDVHRFVPTISEYIEGKREEPVTGEKASYFKEYCRRLVSHVEDQLHEIEEAEELWEATFNSITDMIALCDTSGKLLKVNNAALKFLNLSIEDAVGKRCPQLFEKDEFDHGKLPFKEAISTGKPVSVEMSIKKPAGTFNITVYPLTSMNKFVVVAKDVSETVHAFETQACLLEKLKRANQDLNDFAQIVSHDIKAPLRAIIAFSDMLESEYGCRVGAEGKEWLGHISSGARKLQSMINDILLYAKAGNGKRSPSVCIDISALVRDILESLTPPSTIQIDIAGTLPKVEGNTTQFRQVFQNLLSNAIKYVDTEKGVISVGSKNERGNIIFFVKDNGPGIDKKFHERVFRLFDTAGECDDESTGLGLTVVRKIVEANGGRVWVESEPGEGATFFFTYPGKQPCGE